MNEKKNKHLTLADRMEIQECLYKRMTFKAIAALIGKDPTTVSKEVKLHAQTHTNSYATLSETCPKLLKAPFVCQWLQVKILGFLLLSKKGLHRQDGTATVRGDPRVIP